MGDFEEFLGGFREGAASVGEQQRARLQTQLDQRAADQKLQLELLKAGVNDPAVFEQLRTQVPVPQTTGEGVASGLGALLGLGKGLPVVGGALEKAGGGLETIGQGGRPDAATAKARRQSEFSTLGTAFDTAATKQADTATENAVKRANALARAQLGLQPELTKAAIAEADALDAAELARDPVTRLNRTLAEQLNLDAANSKPVIQNEDGSVSTEKTITVESNGRFFNIPTIINGKEVSVERALTEWQAGLNPAVGEAGTLEEAESLAQQRSDAIGKSLAGSGGIDLSKPIPDDKEKLLEFVTGKKFTSESAAAQEAEDRKAKKESRELINEQRRELIAKRQAEKEQKERVVAAKKRFGELSAEFNASLNTSEGPDPAVVAELDQLAAEFGGTGASQVLRVRAEKQAAQLGRISDDRDKALERFNKFGKTQKGLTQAEQTQQQVQALISVLKFNNQLGEPTVLRIQQSAGIFGIGGAKNIDTFTPEGIKNLLTVVNPTPEFSKALTTVGNSGLTHRIRENAAGVVIQGLNGAIKTGTVTPDMLMLAFAGAGGIGLEQDVAGELVTQAFANAQTGPTRPGTTIKVDKKEEVLAGGTASVEAGTKEQAAKKRIAELKAAGVTSPAELRRILREEGF